MNDSKSSFSHDLWLATVIALLILNSGFALYVVAANLDYIRLPPHQSIEEQAQTEQSTDNNNGDSATNSTASNAEDKTKAEDGNRNDHQEYPENIVKTRDLYAQEGMWLAAYAIFGFAVFQLAASILALVFIARTFTATKDTADAAVRTAKAAVSAEKAYVYIEFKTKFTNDGTKREFEVTPVISNLGKTPAIGVDFNINISQSGGTVSLAEPGGYISRGRVIGNEGSIKLEALGPCETAFYIGRPHEERKKLSFKGFLRYSNVFDVEDRTTRWFEATLAVLYPQVHAVDTLTVGNDAILELIQTTAVRVRWLTDEETKDYPEPR